MEYLISDTDMTATYRDRETFKVNFNAEVITNVPVEEAYASLDLVYNQIGGFIGDFAKKYIFAY